MQKLRLFGMNGVFALILACTAGVVRGQHTGYLILIDAENKQPFTARIGETLMQSSVHGHLLIGQLRDSAYELVIRFPRTAVSDQVFPVNIRKKDQGLQLKGAGNSWVLYNWQSNETIRPVKELDSSRLLEQGMKREDGFSRLMASVVNDTSVMYNTFTWNNFSKDSLNGKSGGDSTALLAGDKINAGGRHGDPAGIVKNSKKPDSDSLKLKAVVAKAIPQKPEIKKLREVSLKVSRKMVFQDLSSEGEKDTITLFVYFEKPEPAVKKIHEDPMITARRLLKNDGAGEKPDRVERESHPSAKEGLVTNTKDGPGKEQKILKTDTAVAALNRVSVCTHEATDSDVEALRTAILIRNTEDDKISVASGAFAMKCFSVTQLRLLADLFVSDGAKYRFLHAAHGHVSDGDHFQELADLLLDKTYVKKFISLLHKRG